MLDTVAPGQFELVRQEDDLIDAILIKAIVEESKAFMDSHCMVSIKSEVINREMIISFLYQEVKKSNKAKKKQVAERKRAEEALRNAEQKKTAILNSLSEHVLCQDAEMRILWANRAAGESVGLTPEELVEHHCYEIWQQRSEPCDGCPVIKARETGQPQEAEITTPDGRVWFIRGDPVRDATGDIVGTVEITLEITERKRAEEELRESEQNFRDLVENSPDGIIIADEKGAHLFANQRAAEITGYTVDELQNITIKEMTLPEELDMYAERYQERIMGEPVPKQYERLIVRKDGTTVLTELTTKTTVWKGKVCSMATVRDITERKQAEEELAKYREHLEELVKARTVELEEKTAELQQANIHLQELDRLKSMFIASMSHELRTPLNSIIGFTGIILRGMTGEITEEQRKQLTMVKNSANHLLALINDVIDVSKIEAGKVELTVEEFDLSALVQGVKDSFSVTAAEKSLKMYLDMPETFTIESDERRTKQVIVNLVGNALKFTDKGEIELKVTKKDRLAEVSVGDTGIGIREEDLDKLFMAFNQIPIEGRLKEGTGLGLYLSKKIANLLGGEIKAESEFGKGSEFTFSLPIKYEM